HHGHGNLERVPLLVREREIGRCHVPFGHRPVAPLPRSLVSEEEVAGATGAEEAAGLQVDHVLVRLGDLPAAEIASLVRPRHWARGAQALVGGERRSAHTASPSSRSRARPFSRPKKVTSPRVGGEIWGRPARRCRRGWSRRWSGRWGAAL